MWPFPKKKVKAPEKPQLLGEIWYRGYKITSGVKSYRLLPETVTIHLWWIPSILSQNIINSECISVPPKDPSGEELRLLVGEAIARQKHIVDEEIAKNERIETEQRRIEALLSGP